MALWLFLLICELIFPLGMILFGRGFMTHPIGKEQKPRRGLYRRWGKRWIVIGGVLLAAAVMMQILLLGQPPAVLGIGSGVLAALQILVMAAVVLPPRRAMKAFAGERQI